jgi:hypothetical protein
VAVNSDRRSWYFFGDFHELKFNTTLKHYERQGKGGDVAPILSLPENKWPEAKELDGNVSDIEIGSTNTSAFTIHLYRAIKKSVPLDLLEGPEGFKKLTPAQCRKLFSDNGAPLDGVDKDIAASSAGSPS